MLPLHRLGGFEHLGRVKTCDLLMVHGPKHSGQVASSHGHGLVEPHTIEGFKNLVPADVGVLGGVHSPKHPAQLTGVQIQGLTKVHTLEHAQGAFGVHKLEALALHCLGGLE